MKTLIMIIISAIVFGSMGYFFAKRVDKPSQVIPSAEVFKNSSEESTTTTAVDADSTYLKEEAARKRQRDVDREECIANVDQYDGSNCKLSARACASFQVSAKKRVDEEIDRCYFRFPNN